jgi:DNA-binding GntR family transcriptional regulator
MARQAERTGPKYRRIADDLRDRITAGEFADAQLPPKKALMAEYSAALATLDSALDVLRQEGRIETVQGSGTFARTPPDPAPEAGYASLEKRVESLEVGLMEVRTRLGYEPRGQERDTSGKARNEQAG